MPVCTIVKGRSSWQYKWKGMVKLNTKFTGSTESYTRVRKIQRVGGRKVRGGEEKKPISESST